MSIVVVVSSHLGEGDELFARDWSVEDGARGRRLETCGWPLENRGRHQARPR